MLSYYFTPQNMTHYVQLTVMWTSHLSRADVCSAANTCTYCCVIS